MSDEFYIGYEPAMPAQLSVRIRRTACILVSLALVVAATLVLAQDRFAPGIFEYGRARTFIGDVVEFPYPALSVHDGTEVRTYWLIGAGKHGAANLVRGRDGSRVRLSGSLIERDGEAMIEVAGDSIITIGAAADVAGPLRSRGIVVVEGEIVDSKCHLGVMKPGEGPAHRDCAVRCLLGQVPPMFVARGRSALGRVSLLSEAAQPFIDAGPYAGRLVSIRGELLQRGTQTFVAVAQRDIRLLD